VLFLETLDKKVKFSYNFKVTRPKYNLVKGLKNLMYNYDIKK